MKKYSIPGMFAATPKLSKRTTSHSGYGEKHGHKGGGLFSICKMIIPVRPIGTITPPCTVCTIPAVFDIVNYKESQDRIFESVRVSVSLKNRWCRSGVRRIELQHIQTPRRVGATQRDYSPITPTSDSQLCQRRNHYWQDQDPAIQTQQQPRSENLYRRNVASHVLQEASTEQGGLERTLPLLHRPHLMPSNSAHSPRPSSLQQQQQPQQQHIAVSGPVENPKDACAVNGDIQPSVHVVEATDTHKQEQQQEHFLPSALPRPVHMPSVPPVTPHRLDQQQCPMDNELGVAVSLSASNLSKPNHPDYRGQRSYETASNISTPTIVVDDHVCQVCPDYVGGSGGRTGQGQACYDCQTPSKLAVPSCVDKPRRKSYSIGILNSSPQQQQYLYNHHTHQQQHLPLRYDPPTLPDGQVLPLTSNTSDIHGSKYISDPVASSRVPITADGAHGGSNVCTSQKRENSDNRSLEIIQWAMSACNVARDVDHDRLNDPVYEYPSEPLSQMYPVGAKAQYQLPSLSTLTGLPTYPLRADALRLSSLQSTRGSDRLIRSKSSLERNAIPHVNQSCVGNKEDCSTSGSDRYECFLEGEDSVDDTTVGDNVSLNLSVSSLTSVTEYSEYSARSPTNQSPSQISSPVKTRTNQVTDTSTPAETAAAAATTNCDNDRGCNGGAMLSSTPGTTSNITEIGNSGDCSAATAQDFFTAYSQMCPIPHVAMPVSTTRDPCSTQTTIIVSPTASNYFRLFSPNLQRSVKADPPNGRHSASCGSGCKCELGRDRYAADGAPTCDAVNMATATSPSESIGGLDTPLMRQRSAHAPVPVTPLPVGRPLRFGWEFDFNSRGDVFDSDPFSFAGSMWRLTFQRNGIGATPSQSGAMSYGLMISHISRQQDADYAVCIRCDFRLHCDLRTPYAVRSLDTAGRQGRGVTGQHFNGGQRTTSSSRGKDGGGAAEDGCYVFSPSLPSSRGHQHFIGPEVMRYVKNGKLTVQVVLQQLV